MLRALLAASHGIPRSLEILAGHLRQSPRPDPGRLLGSPLAVSLAEDAARTLHEGLDDRERQLLETIAVLQVPPEVDALADLSGIDGTDAALDALLARHALRLDDGRLVLHALDRQYAMRRLAAAARREDLARLHRRAARYHAARARPRPWTGPEDFEPAWQEIHHLLEIRDHGAVSRALETLEPDVRHWTAQNLQIARVRERLAGTLGGPAEEEKNHGRLATALWFGQEREAAVPHFERAIALARKRRSDEHLATWLADLGNTLRALGDSRRAARSLNQALEVARRRGDEALASRILIPMAALAFGERRFEDARSAAAEALRLSGGTPGGVRARAAHARILILLGDRKSARPRRARAEAEASGNLADRVLSLGLLGLLEESEQNDAEAIAHFGAAADLARRATIVAALHPALLALADVLLACGRFDEARTTLEEHRRLHGTDRRGCDTRLRLLDVVEGRAAPSPAHLERAIAELDAGPEPGSAEWTLAALYTRLALNEGDAALAVARRSARAMGAPGLLRLVRSKLRWLERAWGAERGPRRRIRDIARAFS